jgi:hypothetical protein
MTASSVGMEQTETMTKTATCSCGALTVTAVGRPIVVNACSCFDCQRRSGSAFTYTAFFPDARVEIQGEFRSFRETRSAGRWHESRFCLVCGVSVMSRLEVFPELTGIAVGCFADPAFAPPEGFYWSSRRHGWVPLPVDIAVYEAQ